MKQKYWIFLALTVLLLVALLLPACTKTDSTSVAPKTLKFSYTQPKGASVAKGFEWFGPEFEKRTDGRYKIEIYPASTLVTTTAALDAVKSGVCEIVMTSVGSFPKDFPLTSVASLPAFGFYPKTADDEVNTYKAAMEFVNANTEIQNEFKNFKLLQAMCLDPYNLISKKTAIHSAADFKGLKVGGSGGKMELVSGNGGAAVQQVPPNTYDNMQKGLIDAAFVNFSQVGDYHLYDLADYYYTQDFGGGFMVILMNWNAWNAMSAKDQKILMETWQDAGKVSGQGSLDSIAAGKDATIKAGKTITDPTAAEKAAWVTTAAPAIAKWRNDAKALGATDATLDKMMASWQTIHDKYAKLIK
jgi:TRAP-type C4-dicarboxylate transport system substrate-binding protein